MTDRVTIEIEAENRILHRVIETISSSLDLDVVLDETIDLVMAGDARGRVLPPPVRRRAQHAHAASGLRGIPRTSSTGYVLDMGEGVAGMGRRAPRGRHHPGGQVRRSSLQVHPRAARQAVHLAAVGAARLAERGKLVGAFNVHARERRDFSERRRGVPPQRRLRSSPPRSSTRTSSERSRRRRRPSRTSFGGRSRRRRRNGGASRPRSTMASPSSSSPRGTDFRRCAARCPRTAARADRTHAGAGDGGRARSRRRAGRSRICGRRRWTTSGSAPAPAHSSRDRSRTRRSSRSTSTTRSSCRTAPGGRRLRIAQEALNNVWKHAAAPPSPSRLRPEGSEVLLRIADDGEGSTSRRSGTAVPRPRSACSASPSEPS